MLLAVPLFALVGQSLSGEAPAWTHLRQTVLGLYVRNSFFLLLLVVPGVAFFGSICAWLIVFCDFRGRRFWSLALIVPLTMPAYAAAYAYTDFLEPAGALQTFLRGTFGFPAWEIRTLPGAAFLLIVTLYPYPYLLIRATFLAQPPSALEVAKVLGCPTWKSFFLLSLPLARPAMIVGTSLAALETLADYGLVSFFGVPVLSTGIFNAWTVFGDPISAARIALLLFVVAFLTLSVEFLARRRAQFAEQHLRARPPPFSLEGWRAFAANATCAFPFFFGFVIPAFLLFVRTWSLQPPLLPSRFLELCYHSIFLATTASVLATLLGVVFAYTMRTQPGPLSRTAFTIANFGYAVPGAVLAIAILISVSVFDNVARDWLRAHLSIDAGLILTGSLGALVFAYLVRFQAAASYTIHHGLGKISPALDDAARSLGHTPARVFWYILLPLLRPSLLSAALLVFIDTMKELPSTLLLRPLAFDTLAVRAHHMAADERLAHAARPALAIVLICLPAILWLGRSLIPPGSSSSGASSSPRTRPEAISSRPGRKSVAPPRGWRPERLSEADRP